MPDPIDLDALPEGYRSLRELARRPGVVVHEAEGPRGPVALRVEWGAAGHESRAELEVLSSLEYPGLARLVDFGSFEGPGGEPCRFLARAWVVGEDLAGRVGRQEARDLGRIVARLCIALDHLHGRGFVHGDLKLANVLVTEEGEPVLTDFGLARRHRATGRAEGPQGGSYLSAAPELLAGGRADPRSDLFALGVLLHELLVPGRRDLSVFYAEFPRRSFLDVLGTRDRLPEWCADLVERLCARDPAQRPASAGAVGHVLASRLDLRLPRGEVRLELRGSPLLGREEWARERLLASDGLVTWRVDSREDTQELARSLTLMGWMEGLDVRDVDLTSAETATSRDLDLFCERALRGASRGTILVLHARATATPRTLDVLLRAGSLVPEAPALLLLTDGPGLRGGLEEGLPPASEEAILGFLRGQLEPSDDPRLVTLAERVHADSKGVGSLVAELLADLGRSGLLTQGSLLPRLRPGELPREAGRRQGVAGRTAGLDGKAMCLVAALQARGAPATLEALEAVTGLPAAQLGVAANQALDRGVVRRVLGDEGESSLELAMGPSLRSRLDEGELRELHGNWARILADTPRALVHRWRGRSGPEPELVDEILAAIERLQDARAPEPVLELLEGLERASAERDEVLPAELRGERARAEAMLGMVDEAEARLERLAQEPEGRGQVLRARSLIAFWEQRYADALELLEGAHALGAASDADLVPVRAVVAYEQRDWERVEELVRGHASTKEAAATRQGANLLAVGGMAAFQQGDIDTARLRLGASLEQARRDGNTQHEGTVRINLGLVARRTGALDVAETEFQEARRCFERTGFLPGIAQVQGLYASVLRDRGELRRAEGLLAESLAICERLGDEGGALSKRGILGLVLAERGLAHEAIGCLRESAAALVRLGRAGDACVLEARALELEGRCARLVVGGESWERALAGRERDPRIGVWLARGAACIGRRDLARELLQEAVEESDRLGRQAVRKEARGELDRLDGALNADARLGREGFDPEHVLAEAERELERGASALALRLFHAIAARAERDLAETARERIEVTAEVVHAGLSPEEARFHGQHLLGASDPFPDDFTRDAANARAERDEELEMEVLSILEINQRLVDQQDLPTLLGAIVEAALEVTDAERGFVVLEENGELILDLAFDSRRGDIEEPEVEVSHSIVREALERDGPLRFSNASADPDLGQAPSVLALNLRSVLCQSFVVQDRTPHEGAVRGVIYLDDRLRASAFGERAERLLGLLASQAALAIRQVRRLGEIRELNEQLGHEVTIKESEVRAAQRALDEVGMVPPVSGMVGSSPAMRSVHALLRRVAPSTLPVLVWGESGTGKELAARALHDLSPRREGPFIGENCAALPASLVESELFGSVKGAFTGAERDSPGLFERAHGGTLFLDEIAELPLELQAKLLRALETRTVRRVGGTESIEVDFRLVAATHRDLAAEVGEGRFREDLYYRLDGVRVDLPPLSERPTDIPELVDHFLRLQDRKEGRARKMSPAVLRALCDRPWPGNVRELANEVTRLCILSEEDLADPTLVRPARVGMRESTGPGPLRTLADLERTAIQEALRRYDDDKRKAADALGISRAKLYQRLKQWREEEPT